MGKPKLNLRILIILGLLIIAVIIITIIAFSKSLLFNDDEHLTSDDKNSYETIVSGHNHDIPDDIEDIFYMSFEEYYDIFKHEQAHATKVDLDDDEAIFEAALLRYWRPFLPTPSDKMIDGLVLRNERARLEIYEFLNENEEDIVQLIRDQLSCAQSNNMDFHVMYEDVSWSELHDLMNPYHFGNTGYGLGSHIYQSEVETEIGDMLLQSMVVKLVPKSLNQPDVFDLHFEMHLSMSNGESKTRGDVFEEGIAIVTENDIVIDTPLHVLNEHSSAVFVWDPHGQDNLREIYDDRTIFLNNTYQSYTVVLEAPVLSDALGIDDALIEQLKTDIEELGYDASQWTFVFRNLDRQALMDVFVTEVGHDANIEALGLVFDQYAEMLPNELSMVIEYGGQTKAVQIKKQLNVE